MTDDIAARWLRQAELCRGSSPLYERLCLSIARDEQVADLLRAAPETQRLGILVFAAVQYLLLRGVDHELSAFYPTLGGAATGDPYPAFRDFATTHADRIRALVSTRSTQTNEVNRCTYLMPALARAAGDRPVALVEVGTSAGLNLLCDRYHYDYGPAGTLGDPASPVRLRTEVRGEARAVIPDAFPRIVARVGIDPSPVGLDDDDAVLWLRACIWPEHLARATRLREAIAIARGDPPRIVKGTASEQLIDVAAGTPGDALLCVFHTATAPYFDDDEMRLFPALIREIATERSVAWIAAEGARAIYDLMGIEAPDEGYAVVLGGTYAAAVLATAGYHGDWLRWFAD